MATGSAEAAEANFAALTRRVSNIEDNINNVITTRIAVLEHAVPMQTGDV